MPHIAAATATVTTKGQITIPADIRAAMGIQPGTRVAFTRLPSGATVMRVKSRSARELAGMLGTPPNGRKVSIAEMNLGGA